MARAGRFPHHAAGAGIASIAWAAFWALGALITFPAGEGCLTLQGQNALWATIAALLGAAVAVPVLLAASVLRRLWLLVAGLVIVGTVLAAALVLLASDSATVITRLDPAGTGTCDSERETYGLLYLLWGLPLAAVACEAVYVLVRRPAREAERGSLLS